MEALIVERPEMDVVDVYVRLGPDHALTYEGRYGGPADREVVEAPAGMEAPIFLRLRQQEWDAIVHEIQSSVDDTRALADARAVRDRLLAIVEKSQ